MIKVPSDISVGSDLEMFLYDNTAKKIVPCVGILEGTKTDPFIPDGYAKGFAIQEDNVMVEYNIPPARTVQAFYKAIRHGKKMVALELIKRYGTKYSLFTKSHTHKFAAIDLRSTQAKTIGCEPDFDAYEGGNMRTDPPAPDLMRSCGGHIHIGGDFRCPDFVAGLFMELFIGVRGMIFAGPGDARAKWYGKPGIFRPKPYGIEYRTPNNKWAMGGAQTELVGNLSLRCARYMTETDAVTLQASFRAVEWVKVRKYMSSSKRTEASKKLRHSILLAAAKAEIPL